MKESKNINAMNNSDKATAVSDIMLNPETQPLDPALRDPENSRPSFRLIIIIFSITAVIVLLSYTLMTNHIWEDFFITFRCSKNLAEGNGLVYEVGERVHVFTSPLGVLLPALTHILTGKKSYLEALWLFRLLFCIPAFIGGGVFIFKMLNKFMVIGNDPKNEDSHKHNYLPFLFIALFYLFDVKSVMFTMNGMETGLMLFFFMWALYLMQEGISKHWLLTGVAWGGLMWTRPDSCFYIAAMVVTSVVFGKTTEKVSGVSVQVSGEEGGGGTGREDVGKIDHSGHCCSL
jgi:hypothetical protein